MPQPVGKHNCVPSSHRGARRHPRHIARHPATHYPTILDPNAGYRLCSLPLLYSITERRSVAVLGIPNDASECVCWVLCVGFGRARGRMGA
jgi:hypothetical protein